MVKGSFLGATGNNNSCWLQLTFVHAVIPFSVNTFFSETDSVKVRLGKFPRY